MKQNKTVRKVLQIGECMGITLPADYLRETGLKRGDYIEFVFHGGKGTVHPIQPNQTGDDAIVD